MRLRPESTAEPIFYTLYQAPVGSLTLSSDGQSLTRLALPSQPVESLVGPCWVREDRLKVFATVRSQLDAYFDGQLTEFDLPLHFDGTEFQRLVWRGLLAIPYGQTISYAELANRIGREGASRAVGAANGRNPIAIIAPCHRVIGANGTLTGYGGGLELKAWLIRLEAEVLDTAANRGRLARQG
jgi:methylated-DNA-[protein]-cysteine S-methyltransferase